jgi:PAS domain S-box-containing protein
MFKATYAEKSLVLVDSENLAPLIDWAEWGEHLRLLACACSGVACLSFRKGDGLFLLPVRDLDKSSDSDRSSVSDATEAWCLDPRILSFILDKKELIQISPSSFKDLAPPHSQTCLASALLMEDRDPFGVLTLWPNSDSTLSSARLSMIQKLLHLLEFDLLGREKPPGSNRFMEILLKDSRTELGNLRRSMDLTTILAITNPRGIITYVNDEFSKISGYTKDELLGQNHRIVNSGYHSKKFWKQLWKTIGSGEVWKGTIRNRAKNGEPYWVKTTIIPFKDAHGEIFEYVAVRTDITDLVRAKDALSVEKAELKSALSDLSASQQDLRQASRTANLGTMAAGIAHDFNNTLSIILMGVELCLDQEEPDRTQHILERIKKTAREASSFTHKLMSLGKKQVFKETPLSMPTVLNQSLELLKPQLKSLGIELHLSHDEPFPLILGDEASLMDIIRNLVLNSLQAIELMKSSQSESNGHSRIQLRSSLAVNHLCIEVLDNGPGIPKNIQPLIFDPFFTTKDQSSQKGTGLGLSMVSSIIESLGGKIEVESPATEALKNAEYPIFGPGTLFNITLPVTRANSRKSPEPETKSIPTSSSKTLIYFVDDEKYLLNFVKVALARFGYENVCYFSDGKDCVEILQSNLDKKLPLPKLIICDLQMPSLSGFEVFKYLKTIPKGLRPEFIPMTGKQTHTNLDFFIREKVADILEKPFQLSRLRSLIQDVLKP